MRGDTIDLESFTNYCRANETQQQRWVRQIIGRNESRVLGDAPAVVVSEGYGITTYAWHAGGGVHTMTTAEWQKLRIFPSRRK